MADNLRRTLITGGAGFIGSALARRFAEDSEVVVLDNLSSGARENLEGLEVELIEGDVTSRETTDLVADGAFNVVMHAAANASVPGSVADPWLDAKTNVLGTMRVLDGLRKSPSTRMVFLSSAAVYGGQTHLPINETALPSPESPYGASKAAAEAYCMAYAKCHCLAIVVARIFNVFGPRAPRFVVHDFVEKLTRDPHRLTVLGDGRQVRDFLYVQDAVAALAALARRGVPGQAYNVASGVGTCVTDLARMVASAMGLPEPKFEYTGCSWRGDIHAWYADTARIRDLGFQPQFSLEEGLRHTIPPLIERL